MMCALLPRNITRLKFLMTNLTILRLLRRILPRFPILCWQTIFTMPIMKRFGLTIFLRPRKVATAKHSFPIPKIWKQYLERKFNRNLMWQRMRRFMNPRIYCRIFNIKSVGQSDLMRPHARQWTPWDKILWLTCLFRTQPMSKKRPNPASKVSRETKLFRSNASDLKSMKKSNK